MSGRSQKKGDEIYMLPTFISYEEQDELGSALVESRESRPQKRRPYVDIDDLAESFGLRIRYEDFAEDDPNKDGFLSGGTDSLMVLREGVPKAVTFPRGTIVIDRRLLDPRMDNERRFVIAHEVAHHITDVQQPRGRFHNEFDPGKYYSENELKELFAFVETQNDNLGAILLTPTHKLQRVFRDVAEGELLPRYGYRILDADTRERVEVMADVMRVPYTIMRDRLERLDLFDQLPIEQYIESGCFDLEDTNFRKETEGYVK